MNTTDPNPNQPPTEADYIARAEELIQNGHDFGAAELYAQAGFPEMANALIESGHDIVDDEE